LLIVYRIIQRDASHVDSHKLKVASKHHISVMTQYLFKKLFPLVLQASMMRK